MREERMRGVAHPLESVLQQGVRVAGLAHNAGEEGGTQDGRRAATSFSEGERDRSSLSPPSPIWRFAANFRGFAKRPLVVGRHAP
jgi:hypothetical protein